MASRSWRSRRPVDTLEERYGDHAGFVAAVRRAAEALVGARFMLPPDAAAWIEAAEASDVLLLATGR